MFIMFVFVFVACIYLYSVVVSVLFYSGKKKKNLTFMFAI